MKQSLKKIPGVYSLFLFLRHPILELRRWAAYASFRRRYGKVLRFNAPSGAETGRLLVVNLSDDFVGAFKLESLLVKGMELQGLKPFVLTNRGSWVERYYQCLGLGAMVHFGDYFQKAAASLDEKDVDRTLEGVSTFQDLMGLEYEGAKIGKYICSSLVRMKHSGSVDPRDAAMRVPLRRLIRQTMVTTRAAKTIYDELNPACVLLLERGYTPFGEFFDLALNRGINTIQWCGCHKDNGLTLKRYSRGNDDQHPASLSAKTWEKMLAMNWTPELGEQVRRELFRNYSSGSWFSEVGTQFNKRQFARAEIQRQLGMDPNKKTAVLFSHLFWDATFFWGEDLFRDYQEWLVESVRAACDNPRVNWVVKLHPANLVKLHRDGYSGELVEKKAIREAVGTLPPHVKLLEPQTPISTYALFGLMDYCVTVRGTIGIEAAMFGIPVLTAGTGRYDRHGFTIDSASRQEYLEKLSRIETIPRLTGTQVELAEKFGYATFLLRPFEFTSIENGYKKDKAATQVVSYKFKSEKEISDAADLRSFGQWAVGSKDEDYLAVPLTGDVRRGREGVSIAR